MSCLNCLLHCHHHYEKRSSKFFAWKGSVNSWKWRRFLKRVSRHFAARPSVGLFSSSVCTSVGVFFSRSVHSCVHPFTNLSRHVGVTVGFPICPSFGMTKDKFDELEICVMNQVTWWRLSGCSRHDDLSWTHTTHTAIKNQEAYYSKTSLDRFSRDPLYFAVIAEKHYCHFIYFPGMTKQ